MEYAPLDLPKLPSFAELSGGLKTDANYGNIVDVIKRAGAQPGLTESFLPQVAGILAPGGQATSPYAKAIEAGTAANVSASQSDAMKRGLTGSDIEAANMNTARATGASAMAELYGETANQYADMIWRAVSGDMNNNRDLLMTLAEAMGQELTSQRDMQMFQQALRASIEEAERMRRSKRSAGLAGGLGGLAGGVAGLYFSGGNPAAGQLGMGMGQGLGAGLFS